MGGTEALPAELIAATVFVVIAVIGFRTSLWWVAAGIAGHGLLFDWGVHPHLIANRGMPAFWPAFCGSIDIALGALIAILLFCRAIPARRSRDVDAVASGGSSSIECVAREEDDDVREGTAAAAATGHRPPEPAQPSRAFRPVSRRL
jgi:hypothetical protein